jgi:hypothetical protein
MGVLVMIAAGVAVPTLGTIAVQSLTLKPDLYYLVVRTDAQPSSPPITDWSDLAGKPCDCRVRMLGYMMDYQRPIPDGTSVSNFAFVPDVGTLLIPAPWVPEETIDVLLRAGGVARFKSRKLVWAEGVLTACYVSNRGTDPLYCLTDAAALGAEPGDINRIFRKP